MDPFICQDEAETRDGAGEAEGEGEGEGGQVRGKEC